MMCAGARTLEAVRASLERRTAGLDRVGVAFSGGVDSALVSRICPTRAMLLTVGFEASHDIGYAARTARTLGLPHHTHIITLEHLKDAYQDVLGVMPGNKPLSWYENGMALSMVSEMACGLGLDAVLTANGIDELFCGYDSYRRIYHEGEEAIGAMIIQKRSNEVQMMRYISDMVGRRGVLLEQPLLSGEFVKFSDTIPIHHKIRGTDDYLRKHAIRAAASLAGLPPSICLKRKKAMQYGTRIHHHLLRLIGRRQNGPHAV